MFPISKSISEQWMHTVKNRMARLNTYSWTPTIAICIQIFRSFQKGTLVDATDAVESGGLHIEFTEPVGGHLLWDMISSLSFALIAASLDQFFSFTMDPFFTFSVSKSCSHSQDISVRNSPDGWSMTSKFLWLHQRILCCCKNNKLNVLLNPFV